METITKHTIWAITILLTVAMLCGTLIYLNHNAWTMRFEMDNNTKEAVQSIEWEYVTEQPISECAILHSNGTYQEINCFDMNK